MRIDQAPRGLTSWHTIIWGFIYLTWAILRIHFSPRGLSRKLSYSAPATSKDATPTTAAGTDTQITRECVRTISGLSRRMWPEPTCLAKSLALQRLMQRYGESTEVRVLMRKSESPRLEFHAVVCRNDQVIFGDDGKWTEAQILKPQTKGF